MYEQTGTPQQRQVALDGDRTLWRGEVDKMRQLVASSGMDYAAIAAFGFLRNLDHLVLARWALAGLCDAADVSHLADRSEIVEAIKAAFDGAPACNPGRICLEHTAPYVVETLASAGMLRCADPDGGA